MTPDGAPAPILFCAATREELETVGIRDAEVLEEGRLWIRPGDALTFAVTGVGIPSTLLRLPAILQRVRPAFVVNTGIAGAYPGSALAVGDLVLGESECFSDLGMELPGEERFAPLGTFPFADDAVRAPLPLHVPPSLAGHPHLKRGRGATVNSCTGTDGTGALRRRLFDADFESMEGAAVVLAAAELGLPVVEIRAVSNLAAARDMKPDNIRRALDALTAFWHVRRDVARELAP